VTITELLAPDDPEALRAWFGALARYDSDEPRAVPEGGEPLVGFDLTTHAGHFMGRGHDRLLLYTRDGQAAAGTWDAMPHAFSGQGAVERLSLLHRLRNAIA
jgi:hypothetical protein